MKLKTIKYIFLLPFIFLILYFGNNLSFLYSNMANFYYKNGNIERTQDFLEKSFKTGNHNSKQRSIYVNSLINSPLSLKSQEKLALFAEDNIQDEASFKAKNFLDSLRFEIAKKYPNNYIQQAPYNQKVLRWSHFPITYKFKNTNNVPKYFIDEIEKALLEWEKNAQIMFQPTTSESANIFIDFKTKSADKFEYEKKYVIAYTTPNIINNELKDMTINFYSQAPNGKFFTSNQVYNTALHEIFHAMGFLGHSYNQNDIMYLSKDCTLLEEEEKDKLSEADILTLKLLYKIKPDITSKSTQSELPSEYIPYLILGNSQEVTYSKKQEAENYIYHAPTLPAGYIDLAETLVTEKRYEEAIKNLEKALYLADSDEIKFIVYYNLAVTYYYIDYPELALMYLKKASEIKDEDSLQILKAEIYIKDNQIGNAIKEYNNLIRKDNNNKDYVITCAKLYIKDNKRKSARKLLKDYLKRHPEQKVLKEFSQFGFLVW